MPDRALDLFRDACGLLAPLTLEVRDPSAAAGVHVPHPMERPFAIVGRDPQADLVLPNPQVSRRHALLQAVGGRLLCIDLLSRTKLRWDGEAGQRDRGWLAPGRDLLIGPYAIRWAGTGLPAILKAAAQAPVTPLELDSLESASLPQAALASPLRNDDQDSHWQINTRVALVGRSESCHLFLGHESVSRFHASLIRTPKGVWIVDLLAREGVFVNGQGVRWAWLEDGDTVRIGRFTFILRYKTVPPGISRREVPLAAGAAPTPHPGIGPQRPRAQSSGRGTGLAVRSRKPYPEATPVVTGTEALSPVLLESSGSAGWELTGTVPPQQIAIWQQQMRMMETFHDDMMLMIQMFMAMHREHLEAVKDELDKVRELSQELGQLQEKLADPPRSSQEARPPNGSATVPRNGTANGLPGRQRGQSAAAMEASFVTNRLTTASVPTSYSGPTDPTATAAPDSKQSSETRPLPGDQSKLHLDITRRITELQRERQGYWQRILSAINKQPN